MQIANAIQSIPVATEIRESALVYPVIMTTHLACIAVFGGMILVTNFRLLGWAFKKYPAADVVNGLRIWKRIGFCIMVSMGIMLAGSEAEKYSGNPFFWWKMLFLGLALTHAFVFRRSVYGKAAEFDAAGVIPGKAKVAAALSIFLWFGVLTFGRLIGYYEPRDKNAEVRSPHTQAALVSPAASGLSSPAPTAAVQSPR